MKNLAVIQLLVVSQVLVVIQVLVVTHKIYAWGYNMVITNELIKISVSRKNARNHLKKDRTVYNITVVFERKILKPFIGLW